MQWQGTAVLLPLPRLPPPRASTIQPRCLDTTSARLVPPLLLIDRQTYQVVTPEFGTSQDPLKAVTSLPRALFRWALRRRLSLQSHGWIPVEQTEQEEVVGQDEENASDGGPAGARLEEAPLPGAEGGVGGHAADFEPLEEEEGGAGVLRGVVITGLRKEFGSKVAVAGLDLRLRVGDITCLLGHNGAGEPVVFFFYCTSVSAAGAWLTGTPFSFLASSVRWRNLLLCQYAKLATRVDMPNRSPVSEMTTPTSGQSRVSHRLIFGRAGPVKRGIPPPRVLIDRLNR